ncbi:hypothetical protein QBC40DRAFT_217488 [Triangularia verruculosa]|uniref:C2H2 type master regulator of conidiophore development brlA n=1 Tax=Triangularia verruculosa TaxID=2587418 RepID=A0AAN6XP78_9PEZI|nr:hypothetical protein QBC40DRAFT_217488 [Triangularia verruculosa]
MALSEHLPAPANWSRWPHHHPTSGDYSMMEHNVMPYESRQTTAAPPQRQPLASQYFASPPFSLAPITNTVPAPQYQPPATYSGYPSYAPSPVLGSPFRAHTYPEQQARVMSVEPGVARGSGTASANHSPVQESRSPSVKAERQLSITDASQVSTLPCKTIEANLPVAGQHTHEFHTPLDTLMKAVQAKTEKPAENQVEAPECPPPSTQNQGEVLTRTKRCAAGSAAPVKRYACGIAGCIKMFSQKTHLDIHRRAHTGESPYQCTLCGKDFTQPGNLKAHWRRHMGEKPFQCTLCDKRFPQRGNLQAHMKSHDKTRPFICLLDSCNKAFSVRGNLKSHQNKFHEDTIRRLTARFATIADWSTASHEDKELFQYLSNLYKNSNKGIKGRGKRRNVAVIVPQQPGHLGTPVSPTNSMQHHHHHASPHSNSYQLHGLPQLQLCVPQPRYDGLPYHGVSSPAAYNMSSRPTSLMVNMPGRRPHSGYGMYDTDESSVSSSGPVTPNPHHMYSDEHTRDLAFSDRMPY